MVGITGTNGKTTTSHLVRAVLEAAGIPCGVIGTLGGAFGGRTWPLANTTPLALELQALLAAQRDAGAKAVAMEVSSHALALGRVDDVRLRVGVLTNITRDHLDFHGTIERYVAAKRHLFDLAPVAVLNLDDPAGARFAAELPRAARRRSPTRSTTPRRRCTRPTCGWRARARAFGSARATSTSACRAASTCATAWRRWASRGRWASARSPRCAAWPASAPCRAGWSGSALSASTRSSTTRTRPTRSRTCCARCARRLSGRLIVVFGCGGDRDAGKRPEMGAVARRLADWVIITSDNPRGENAWAIARAVADGNDIEIELDRRAAIRRAIDAARPGDVVVVAGKGHENYQIVGADTHPFDDRDEVRSAFSRRAASVRR